MFIPENTGIIVQARMASTRLPGKVLKPFAKGTILQIITEKLHQQLPGYPLIIATSTNEKDNAIEQFAFKNDFLLFRGEEKDVLKRFIDAAKNFKLQHIIRVCADNPFLDIDLIKSMINVYTQHASAEYISFRTSDNTPAMQTHFGFFAEIVSLKALQKIHQLTTLATYREHVTNYIYKHPSKFNIRWLTMPEFCNRNSKQIRLTIDTEVDFKNATKIHQALVRRQGKNYTTLDVIGYLQDHPDFLEFMREQIERNQK